MGNDAQDAEDYRLGLVGEESEYWYNYGVEPSGWPAYIKTGQIIKLGIWSLASTLGPYYKFSCYTSALIMNCRDQHIGTKLAGGRGGGFNLALVTSEYETVLKQVLDLNPASLSIIDIRTLNQILGGCCPKALEILILEAGAD